MTREKLKKMHQKQIFLCARGGAEEYSGVSRAELTTKLKLSFPSISVLVEELLDAGVLVETGACGGNDRGRPRTLLRVKPDIVTVPVFELKSEGYRFVLYDIYGKRIEESFFCFAGKGAGTWNPTLEQLGGPIVDTVNGLCDKYNLSDVVLSLPGNINAEGKFSSSSAGIVSPPGFLDYLEAETGCRMVVTNRADCFAYGERMSAQIPENYIFIYVSDGLGAGIIRSGKIVKHGTWRAGEIGHMSIDYRGRSCPCGSKGCLEQYLGAAAITRDGQALLPEGRGDFSAICRAYKDGVPEIEALIEEKAEIMCAGINNMLTLHPIPYVIIGGRITELGTKFLDCLDRKIQLRASRKYRDKMVLTLSKSHGEDSTVGAFHNYVTNIMDIDVMLSWKRKEGKRQVSRKV